MKIRSINSKQTGAGLMEVLVAMSISLVVTASMVALMANSLSSTARIIHMTKLSDDMRVALQMMSRDVRRSAYNANAALCYGYDECASEDNITLAGDITISDSGDCLTFLLDRDRNGDSTDDDPGGFRRVTDGNVGVLEMWIGDATPDCMSDAGAAGWVQITDPENMDISEFAIDDDLSYTEVIQDNGFGDTLSLRVRKIHLNLRGHLVTNETIKRQMEDTISIRNDLLL
jgi:type II secretory pathway component PulJ